MNKYSDSPYYDVSPGSSPHMSLFSLLYNAHCVRRFPHSTRHCASDNRNELAEERSTNLTDIFDEALHIANSSESTLTAGISSGYTPQSLGSRRKNTGDDFNDKTNNINSQFPLQ